MPAIICLLSFFHTCLLLDYLGDFHSYRASRNIERDRLRKLEEEWKKEQDKKEFEEKKLQNEKEMQLKTEKNREKRKRKKERKEEFEKKQKLECFLKEQKNPLDGQPVMKPALLENKAPQKKEESASSA